MAINLEFILFCAAALLSSFISGMTGLGGGILLLAFMTPLFPPSVLIPLHGVIQLMSNTTRVGLSIKKVDVRIFLTFALGAAIGTLSSAPLTISLSSLTATFILAAAILFFTWYPRIEKSFDFKGKFFVVGGAASFLSTFVGATGPLTAPFFLNSRLDKESFVPTKAACQIPIHLFKVILYMSTGFLLSQWLIYILSALPLVIAGNYLGKKATDRFNEKKYKMIIKGVITLLVIRMIFKAFV